LQRLGTLAVDITFWVIQAVLLTPVLFLAASVGIENHPARGRRIFSDSDSNSDSNSKSSAPSNGSAEPPAPQAVVATPSVVAAAVAGLSQFTAEQQARLVLLRSFVQEARSGRGSLSDDLAAAPEVPVRRRASWRPRLGNRELMFIGGIVLMGVGLVGVVRTSMAMDDLQRTSVSAQEPLTAAERLLPGVILNPAKYLSAVNASSGASSARVDQLYAVNQMQEKQAMDRWEALVGIGLSLLLFVNAMRAAAANEDEETSVAFDFAPFLLVAAVLFAGLSFFELP
jgi:hypothetical protein